MLEHCTISVNKELDLYRIFDKSTGLSISTVCTGGLTKQKEASLAMGLAKFSRSSESFENNLGQVFDGSASLEKIAIGYGHTSVAGMVHTNLEIEDVSILDSMNFFYNNSLIDGQERSTRYQNFDRFISVPSNIGSNSLRNKYKDIVKSLLSFYKEMYEPTYKELSKVFSSASEDALKRRTLDCTRYLLPLATKTSFGAVLSARAISKYISDLGAQIDPVSTRLRVLLEELFTIENDSYRSECSFLLRHTEPSLPLSPLLEVLKSIKHYQKSYQPDTEPSVSASVNYGMEHVLKLIDSSLLMPHQLSAFNEEIIGRVLAKYDCHNEAPHFLREGLFSVYGFLDIGSIKDLNRHRSLSKLIPFLHQETCMDVELVKRDLNNRFFIPLYFIHNKDLLPLGEDYTSFLKDTYKKIEDWYLDATKEIGVYADLYAKRMVPQAHATTFVYSGGYNDFNYLATLRTKLGGHIQYRTSCYEMIKALVDADLCFFKPLLDSIDRPDPCNETEFKGRS